MLNEEVEVRVVLYMDNRTLRQLRVREKSDNDFPLLLPPRPRLALLGGDSFPEARWLSAIRLRISPCFRDPRPPSEHVRGPMHRRVVRGIEFSLSICCPEQIAKTIAVGPHGIVAAREVWCGAQHEVERTRTRVRERTRWGQRDEREVRNGERAWG